MPKQRSLALQVKETRRAGSVLVRFHLLKGVYRQKTFRWIYTFPDLFVFCERKVIMEVLYRFVVYFHDGVILK